MLDRPEETETVSDDGYRRIRTDIIFGKLPPEYKLRLEAMREDYGVSVTTLREILSRLSADGFVLAEGRRGFEVAPVSAPDLKGLAELRLLLESHAMDQSFARGDMEWEGRVVSAHHKLAATERTMSTKKPNHQLWKRYDGEFHQALISNCGSRPLMEAHSDVTIPLTMPLLDGTGSPLSADATAESGAMFRSAQAARSQLKTRW